MPNNPVFSYQSLRYYFFAFSFSLLIAANGQENGVRKDSVLKKSVWTPAKRATIFSACLPGLGQIQNKKYWKVPVIYSLMGSMGYLIYSNHIKYKDFQSAITYRYDEITGNETFTQYSVDNLVTLKRSFRRFRDFSILGASLIYFLQIIDANVDAHLLNFDVDNISFRIGPANFQEVLLSEKKIFGLSLTLCQKK